MSTRSIQGRSLFEGKDITNRPPNEVVHLGLSRTHQIVKPLNGMTVLENVTVGACFGREYLSLQPARQAAMEVLERVGLADRAESSARSLTIAGKKRLEVARALAAQSQTAAARRGAGGTESDRDRADDPR